MGIFTGPRGMGPTINPRDNGHGFLKLLLVTAVLATAVVTGIYRKGTDSTRGAAPGQSASHAAAAPTHTPVTNQPAGSWQEAPTDQCKPATAFTIIEADGKTAPLGNRPHAIANHHAWTFTPVAGAHVIGGTAIIKGSRHFYKATGPVTAPPVTIGLTEFTVCAA
jgi:hypothetical protein